MQYLMPYRDSGSLAAEPMATAKVLIFKAEICFMAAVMRLAVLLPPSDSTMMYFSAPSDLPGKEKDHGEMIRGMR